MKKSLFIMALGAIALTSCSQDEIIEVKQDAIAFSAFTENASRATYKTSLGESDNFIVYARENDGDGGTTDLPYITGITATTGGAGGGTGSFKLASTYYWPIKPLDFYCISPAAPVGSATPEVNRISVSDNIPSISEYTVGSAHSEDLLYSVALGLKRGGDVGTAGCKVAVGSDGVAAINFRHALAMIQFQFASDATYDLDVKVSSISLVNVAHVGTYSLPSVATSTKIENTNSADVTDYSRGTWNSTNYEQTYTWTESHSATVANKSTLGTTYFLLPQTVTAAEPKDAVWSNAYFKIACVISKDGVIVYSGDVQIPVTTPTQTYTWKEGYKYLYTFTFGKGGGYFPGSDDPAIVPISFNVNVDEMIATEQSVDVQVH